MKIELNDQQLQNLVTFLQRVNLTGAEVPAYLEIVQALNKEFILATKNFSKPPKEFPDKEEKKVEDK